MSSSNAFFSFMSCSCVTDRPLLSFEHVTLLNNLQIFLFKNISTSASVSLSSADICTSSSDLNFSVVHCTVHVYYAVCCVRFMYSMYSTGQYKCFAWPGSPSCLMKWNEEKKSCKRGYGRALSFFLFNFLYKHVYTCILAYWHTGILAYLHTWS